MLQWVPWFLRMKRPGDGAEQELHHSPGESQSKSLSSPATTTQLTSILPQSLASLRASLAQLHHSAPHRCIILPHSIHREPSPNLHPQPNGHLPYMGFQAFPSTAELETQSHSQMRGSYAPAGEDGEALDGGGDMPSHPHLSFGKSQEKPLSLNPDSTTTSSGSCEVDAGTGLARADTSNAQSGLNGSKEVDNQLQALLTEVQFLVERVREQDRQLSIAEQWQFAAAVIDRLCLVGFSVFNIICTIAILMAAPNFGEALAKDFL